MEAMVPVATLVLELTRLEIMVTVEFDEWRRLFVCWTLACSVFSDPHRPWQRFKCSRPSLVSVT